LRIFVVLQAVSEIYYIWTFPPRTSRVQNVNTSSDNSGFLPSKIS
jgi:hypothetical protein